MINKDKISRVLVYDAKGKLLISTKSVFFPKDFFRIKGKDLVMKIGYSHDVIMTEPEGITVEVPSPNKIIIHGIDKQVVGQFAAEVRGKRPPEPYKGKGIKYTTEVIRRKVGKTGGKK